MNKKAVSLLFGAVVLASVPATSHAAELSIDGSLVSPLALSTANSLLSNGNFEANTATNTGGANNLGTVPTSWTVLTTAGVDNTANSNLISGSTLGSGTTTRLGVDPYDTSLNPQGGAAQQSLDISGAGLVSQLFTPALTSPVRVSVDFGGRDNGSDTSAGSYWTIYLGSTNTVVASSSASTVKPAVGAWVPSTTTTGVSLAGGTQYRFVINLDNTQQVDGAAITSVPEPTALAATSLGLSLLGWMGYKRHRRS